MTLDSSFDSWRVRQGVEDAVRQFVGVRGVYNKLAINPFDVPALREGEC